MDQYLSINIIKKGSRNACRRPSLYSKTCYRLHNNIHINTKFCESPQPTRSRGHYLCFVMKGFLGLFLTFTSRKKMIFEILFQWGFYTAQFVIFKPLRFDVKALFASRPVSLLIRWFNKPGVVTKEFWEKAIQFHGTFHGLKITK